MTLLPGAQAVREGNRAVAGVIVVDTRRAAAPRRVPPGSAVMARGDSARRVRRERRTLERLGERHADAFPYTIPEVRGGGEGDASQRGWGALYRPRATEGPVELVARGSLVRSRPSRHDDQSDRSPPGQQIVRSWSAPRTGGHARAERHRFSGSRRGRRIRPRPPAGVRQLHARRWGNGRGRLPRPRSLGGWSGDGTVARRGSRRPVRRRRRAARCLLHPGRAAVRTPVSPGDVDRLDPRSAARLDVWTGQGTPRRQRATRRGMAARAHLGITAGGRQRGHSAGARRPALPGRRRRAASTPIFAPSGCAGKPRRACAGIWAGGTLRAPVFSGQRGRHDRLGARFQVHLEPPQLRCRPARRRDQRGLRPAATLRMERRRHLQRRHVRHPRRRPGAVPPARHLRARLPGRPAHGVPTCAGTASASVSPTAPAPIPVRRSR